MVYTSMNVLLNLHFVITLLQELLAGDMFVDNLNDPVCMWTFLYLHLGYDKQLQTSVIRPWNDLYTQHISGLFVLSQQIQTTEAISH